MPHRALLQTRVPAVQESARILFQKLRQRHGYTGSYDTVTRFVGLLRAVEQLAERAAIRFETPRGLQSRSTGAGRVPFRSGSAVRHFFVPTVGFSRWSFYLPCRDA